MDQNFSEQQQGGFNPFSQAGGFGGFHSGFHTNAGPLDAEDVSTSISFVV